MKASPEMARAGDPIWNLCLLNPALSGIAADGPAQPARGGSSHGRSLPG